MNILLIDDDSDTAFLMDVLIRDLPFVEEYHIKLKAKNALRFLTTYEKPLSCIFVDIKMPEMDGFQFVQKYEEDFRLKFPDTQVYFLTSSARQSDRSRAMEFSSVKEFILKPLSKNKLKEIYERLMN
ncbi:MAG: response regulator [Anditalea sp.]